MRFFNIAKFQDFIDDSKTITIEPNKKFKISEDIIPIKGKPGSCFFGVSIFDSNMKEVLRRGVWITEFDNSKKTYYVIFSTPINAKYIKICHRINIQTYERSDVEIQLDDFSSIKLEEVAEDIAENWSDKPQYFIKRLSPLSIDEEKVLEKKMVWILGSIRSGTTWLGTQLLDHPKNVTWHEPLIGWHIDVVRNWHFGEDRDFFSFHHKNNWLPSLKKMILARTFSQAQTLSKNIVIKEPNGSGAAELLMECFPESKLIFLLRDGRDVVDSIIDAHQENSWNKDNPIVKFEPLYTEEMRLQAIKDHCHEWIRINEAVWNAFQKHEQRLRLLVKYENLLTDAFDELKKIYKFLDVSISDEELKKIIDLHDFKKIPDSEKGSGKFYRSAAIGKWKENFSEKEKELMNSILKETLIKFNYEA